MDQVVHIPLADLHESPFNPRRTFREAGLQELAADIKVQGILSPLLVRPRVPPLFTGDADAQIGFELVFGHRRLRAAALAERTSAPCLVRSMTDLEAARAQIGENLAREDVHPIEEAEGFQALMQTHGVSADDLAAQTGRSRSYIYGRLTLLKACPKIRDACLAGEIGSEVALLVARLRIEQLQEQALSAIRNNYGEGSLKEGGRRSFRQIRSLLLDKFTLDLDRKVSLFDPEDAELLPDAGACITCPKRSGLAPEYEDIAGEHETPWGSKADGNANLCTDPECYGTKKAAHLSVQAAALKAKGKTVVDGAKARAAVDQHGNVKGAYVALKDVKAEVAKARQAAQADSKIVPPLVVTIQDPRTGKTVEAVRTAELQQAGVKVEKKAATQQDNWREQEKKREEERRRRDELAKTERKVRTELLHRVRAAVATRERSAFDLALVAGVALAGVAWDSREALAHLWGQRSYRDLEKRAGQMPASELTTLMLDCALVAHTAPANGHQLDQEPQALFKAAKHYGIDAKAVRAEVLQTPAQPPAEPASTPSPAARARDKAATARPAKKAKAAGPGPVKYRCPDTLSTWSGRGLQPAWIKAALASGKTLRELEVKPTAPAAPTAIAAPEEPGSAGQDQMDDAGVAAGGCDAEVTA